MRVIARNLLTRSIRASILVSGFAAIGLSATALGQTPPAKTKSQKKPATLQTIQVLGSHIRRAQLETANPVIVVTPEQIRRSGDQTIAQVVQNLPAVSGPIDGPNMSNGGSTAGATVVSLHGLGPSRTLVLIDGQRVVNKNLSAIPIGAVERIEVLTNGASSVYGSDAIGGVIDIILRKNFNGLEVQTNAGVSSHGDGQRRGYSAMFGKTSSKGSFVAAVSYNNMDGIQASARNFSNRVLSLTGSTHTPIHQIVSGDTFPFRGFISIPPSLQAKFGCGVLSLNKSASGMTAPTTLSDYHCLAPDDLLNDGDFSQLTESVHRTNAYVSGTYNFTDHLTGYFTGLYDRSVANGAIPPGIFTTLDGNVVSQFNMYNPFGITFGNGDAGSFRFTNPVLGERDGPTSQTSDEVQFGVRGSYELFGHHWSWDIGYDYGRIGTLGNTVGYLDVPSLNPGLGPSMIVNGTPACVTVPGDPGTVIPGCVPWDPFDLRNPIDRAVLQGAEQLGVSTETQLERIKHASLSGGILSLPAGTVQLALGVDYRSEYLSANASGNMVVNSTGFCILGTGCSTPLNGGFSVKTAYGELFVPILHDLPGVSDLNIDLGDRLSKYSDFGSTDNWKVGVEYRPVPDLLLRGTVSQVFRAPSITDLFEPSSFGAIFLNSDPCTGITAANPACVGVPTNGKFVDSVVAEHAQMTGLFSGSEPAGFPLGPEFGKSFDFGVVYSPAAIPGLSGSVDVWRVYLKNVISSVDAQAVLNLCFQGQSQFCPLIHRFPADSSTPGQLNNIALPTANLGRLDVKGIDVQGSYRLPMLPIGQFTATIKATYMSKDDVETAPGTSSNVVIGGAGMYNGDVSALGFIPRIQAQGIVTWARGPWNASWRLQFIGPFNLGSGQVARGYSAVPGFANPVAIRFGAMTYSNLQVGYHVEPIDSDISFGVNNVFNKQPPILGNSNAPSSSDGNTNGNYFDVIGRYYWANFTVHFH